MTQEKVHFGDRNYLDFEGEIVVRKQDFKGVYKAHKRVVPLE